MNRGYYTVYPSLVRDGLNRRPPHSELKPAGRAPSSTASLARLVLVALLLSVPSLAAAYIAYWQYTPVQAGDTVGVSDLNDLGVISYFGFGDAFPGGASAIGGPADPVRDFVRGYGYSGNPHAGVFVTDINDAGDAYGTAIRLDGVRVPTMWIGGVPFDLTDPANAGLHFNYDPGPKYEHNFDLSSLPVVGLPLLPGDILPGDILVSPNALTNTRQDYLFEYRTPVGDFFGLLTAVVPEPGTLVLVVAGMAAALLAARGRRVTNRTARWQRAVGAMFNPWR